MRRPGSLEFEHEGAGAVGVIEGVGAVVVGKVSGGGHAVSFGPCFREDVDQPDLDRQLRVGLGRGDLDGIGIERPGCSDRTRPVGDPEVGARSAGALDAEHHVLCGERRAVVEGHALAQDKLPRGRIDQFPRHGEPWHQRQVSIGHDQALVHLPVAVEAIPPGALWVPGRHAVQLPHADDVLGARGRGKYDHRRNHHCADHGLKLLCHPRRPSAPCPAEPPRSRCLIPFPNLDHSSPPPAWPPEGPFGNEAATYAVSRRGRRNMSFLSRAPSAPTPPNPWGLPLRAGAKPSFSALFGLQGALQRTLWDGKTRRRGRSDRPLATGLHQALEPPLSGLADGSAWARYSFVSFCFSGT